MPVFPLISGCLRLFPLILQGGGAKRGLGAKVGKKINHRVTEAQSQAEPGGETRTKNSGVTRQNWPGVRDAQVGRGGRLMRLLSLGTGY